MQESKYWKHPNNEIVLKGFFYIINFLNHIIVIIEERFAVFILSERFSMTYTLFRLVHFLPYLTSHITYHTSHAKPSFLDQFALLELR
jgi:hypothetical protein